jgi:hypothetical protein
VVGVEAEPELDALNVGDPPSDAGVLRPTRHTSSMDQVPPALRSKVASRDLISRPSGVWGVVGVGCRTRVLAHEGNRDVPFAWNARGLPVVGRGGPVRAPATTDHRTGRLTSRGRAGRLD